MMHQERVCQGPFGPILSPEVIAAEMCMLPMYVLREILLLVRERVCLGKYLPKLVSSLIIDSLNFAGVVFIFSFVIFVFLNLAVKKKYVILHF